MRQQIIFIDGLEDSTKGLFAKYLSSILNLPIISVYDSLNQKDIESSYFSNDYVQDLIKMTQEQNLSYIITNFCLSRLVFASFLKEKTFDFNLAEEINKIFANRFDAKLLYFDVSFGRLWHKAISKEKSVFTLAELFEMQELFKIFLVRTHLPFKLIVSGSTINVNEICSFLLEEEIKVER